MAEMGRRLAGVREENTNIREQQSQKGFQPTLSFYR